MYPAHRKLSISGRFSDCSYYNLIKQRTQHFRDLLNALDWEVSHGSKQHCFFFPAFLSSQTITKRDCQRVNFRRKKKSLLCLMNVNFLIFLVCFSFKLFLYQHHPGRMCQVTRLWEISHTEIPDLRGAEGLAHPHLLRISGCPRPGGPLYSPSHSWRTGGLSPPAEY